MVFDKQKAPKTKSEFMEWYDIQTEWNEEHDYESANLTSLNLKNWFMEMKDTFPPMNGEFAPNEELISQDENLEKHLTDYSIGYDVIYVAFAWSLVDEAYTLLKQLASKYDVGFFDVSGNDGDIILPDGTKLK